MDQAFLYFRSLHFSNRLACDNDEVNILNQLFLQFRECLADFSFDGIPHYGVADFFADGQPYQEMRLSFLIEHINHELAIRFGNTIMKYFLKFFLFLNTKRFPHVSSLKSAIITYKKISRKWRKTEKFLSPLSSQMQTHSRSFTAFGSVGHICHTLHLRKTFLHFSKYLKKKTTETVSDLCRDNFSAFSASSC